MNRYTPVWPDLMETELWVQPAHVLKVWLALRMLKNDAQVVPLRIGEFARRIHMAHQIGSVQQALQFLSAATPVGEGPWIRESPAGYEIVGGKADDDRAAAYDRRFRHAKRERARRAAVKSGHDSVKKDLTTVDGMA